MSKPKYSSEFKIMIAEAYLNREGGFQYIADKYGVGVASVLLWVRCYQHHGKSGFMKKHGNASYSCLSDSPSSPPALYLFTHE